MAKRSKLEITKDILSIIRDNHEIKPTPLLRRSNLSTSRFKEHFSDILSKGLVVKSKNSNGDSFVRLTPKGNLFLEKYRTIIDFISEFDL